LVVERIYALGTITFTANGPRFAGRKNRRDVMVLLHGREMPQRQARRQRKSEGMKAIARRRGGKVTMPGRE
jgi:hypothetical protein